MDQVHEDQNWDAEKDQWVEEEKCDVEGCGGYLRKIGPDAYECVKCGAYYN